ncbi:MAG: biotin--[acetyl-CoA-carboxylase] ligase [Bacillota bacterium]
MTPRRLGRPLIRLETVDSTNRAAAELAGQGAAEGTVVVAEVQTGGRGRLGRSWSSPRGGLWLTTILRPPATAGETVATLALVGGVAVAEAVGRLTSWLDQPPEVRVKWPNDVHLNGRKLAGILGQVCPPDAVLLGIGLNLNVSPEELPFDVRSLATSLGREAGRFMDPSASLEVLFAELSHWYGRWLDEGFAPIRRRCLDLSATIGRPVRVSGPDLELEGEAVDIMDDGALLVRTGGRDTVVRSGDVSVRTQ